MPTPIYDNPNQNVTLQPWMTGGGVGISGDQYMGGGATDFLTPYNPTGTRGGPRSGGNAPYDPTYGRVGGYNPNNPYLGRGGYPNGGNPLSRGTDQFNPGVGSGMFGGLINSMNQLDPGNIYIDNISQGFTNAQLNQYGQDVANAGTYQQQAGAANIAGYQGILNTANQTADQYMNAAAGYQGITDQYGQSANALRQYGNDAANQNMAYAQTGASAQLNNLTGMLGMYQTAANQNQLPGQRIIEQNLGATTSQALNRVREFGGGSNAALGAITDIYGSQMGAQRDIGLQAAQFQNQNQQNYMQAVGAAGQQYGNIYGQLGNAAVNSGAIRSQAEQAASGMYGGAMERQLSNTQGAIQQAGQMRVLGQQGLTEAQSGAAQNMANYYNNLAPQTANMLSSLQQQRMGAEMTQANLSRQAILDAANIMGQGLQTGAQYQDQAWQQNNLAPYQNQMNYYNSMVNGGGGLAANQGQMNAALSMQNSAYNNYANSQAGWGQAAGYGIQIGGQIAQNIPWGEIFGTAASATG